jgi:predicted nucleic acid-binding Zn ribbon protein
MVTRTYRCPSCAAAFRVFGMAMDDGAPPCPKCNWQESEWVPEAISIAGTASKALDASQKIFESEFGLTDFQDRQREGDAAVPLSSEQSKMAETFWGGSKGVSEQSLASFLPNASAWAAESRRQGCDPVSLAMGHKIQPKIKSRPDLGSGVIRQDLGIPKGGD